jgi:mannose-6-phosphate isomerase-like protein (cupin superfamily)
MVAPIHLSKEKMLAERVARFSNLKPTRKAFLDSIVEGHERDICQIIGPGVNEDPAHRPAITDHPDFSLGLIRAEPGHGASLHIHDTVEVFMPLKGRWKIFWGTDETSRFVILEPWDVASCPPHVMRGFRNVGDEEGLLFVIVGGTNPGNVDWRYDVLEEAERRGAKRSAEGNIVKVGAAAE